MRRWPWVGFWAGVWDGLAPSSVPWAALHVVVREEQAVGQGGAGAGKIERLEDQPGQLGHVLARHVAEGRGTPRFHPPARQQHVFERLHPAEVELVREGPERDAPGGGV